MNAAELDEIFAGLLEILEDSSLGWISLQVKEEIATGRLVVRVPTTQARYTLEIQEVAPMYENVTISQSQPLTKGAAIATEPYDAHERVQSLVRALRRAVVDSTSIERYVSSYLSEELSMPGAQLFSADDDSADRILLASTNYQAQQSSRQILQLLDQLAARVADGG